MPVAGLANGLLRVDPSGFAVLGVGVSTGAPALTMALAAPSLPTLLGAQLECQSFDKPSFFQGASHPNAAQRPVEQVSWNSAVAYCQALTAIEQAAGRVPQGYRYRLPREAERECCCRAGMTTEWRTGTSLSTSQAHGRPLSRLPPRARIDAPTRRVETADPRRTSPNPNKAMIRLPTALVFASSLLAQGGPTFVVDAANGPGTNYVDVQAAVLAVPDGSVLLVRPGSYAPVTIDGKGVTVLADSSFTIQGSLQILNTQPQQRVLVRGFVIFGPGNNVVLSSAAGPVTVDAAGQTLSSQGWGQFGLGVYDSQQVVIRNCGVQGAAYAPACVVSNSSVVFENCVLMGAPSMLTSQGGGPLATPGLYATGSAVQFVHSSAAGGAGFVWSWMGIPMSMPAAEAITLNGGSLRAMGLPTHAIAGGTHPTQPQSPSITGTGVARVAPSISLSGLPTGVSLTRPPMPSLLADSAAPGGVLTVQRAGPPGVLCVVVVSLRAVPSSVPWLPDPIWLDMPGMLVEAAGIAPASGVFTVTKIVPNNLSLSGFEFVWQSADLDATGVLAVSNPSPSVVL